MIVLDIGCGLGHFCRFLHERGLRCTYHGYDLVPEYVAACKEQYPDGQFHERVLPRDGIEGQYDVIVLSQVLNVRLLRSDNMRVLERMLTLAFEHARHCVSVDLLSSYVDFREDHLFYYAPEAVFRLAKKLTRRVSLRHDPHPFEFCIQLFREVSEPPS